MLVYFMMERTLHTGRVTQYDWHNRGLKQFQALHWLDGRCARGSDHFLLLVFLGGFE